LAHQQRLPAGASNSPGGFQQQLPALRPKPEHRHPFGVDAAMQPASQTVYHDEEHASVLTLPIMPEPMKPLAAN
jgi:hypothetical protein